MIDDPQSDIRNRISECTELDEDEKMAALQNYPGSLPAQFRLFMTVGQRFEKQGPLRIDFFKRVLKGADEASLLLYAAPISLTRTQNSYLRKHMRFTGPSASSKHGQMVFWTISSILSEHALTNTI